MTIPLDPRFIPAFSIEDVLLDKDTGAPLSGGLVYFEEDAQRGTLKPVYQITGSSPNYTFIQLPNPMVLSSIGTFEDSLGNPVVPYFYPYDENSDPQYYYVRVLSSGLVPQFDRESVPYIGDSDQVDVLSIITNELSNPQFIDVNFDTTQTDFTYSFNAVSQEVVGIAPSWDIIVTASAAGTVTVNQLAPEGELNIPTNPGTILNISSAGVSQLLLRQRLYGSPNLWGNGYLAGAFTAKTYSGTTVTLTMYYSQSQGAVQQVTIVSAILPSSGEYESFAGASDLIPISDSNETFPDAYVDIYFVLPPSIEIDITSVMVAFTGQNPIGDIQYDQETPDRQIDHLFHYYKPQLFFKPINSFLTGWDFPLNPVQLGSTQTVTTTPVYIWDQTIMASATANVNVIRNTTNSALQATTTGGTEAFYLLQYLAGAQAVETALSSLAVNVLAYTAVHPGVNVRVYLYNGNSSSTIPTLPTTIGTIATTGIFTLTAANWTLIPQPDGNSMGPTALSSTIQDYPFIAWDSEGTFYTAGTNNFAIVVTFEVPTSGTQVIISSISCVPGEIATRPAPLTPVQVLNQCNYYYQKSFLPGIVPASNLGENTGASFGVQVPGAATAAIGPIIRFPVPMRATPTVILYNPGASGSQIYDSTFNASWTSSSASFISANGFTTQGTTPAGSTLADGCVIHWVADSRLAIV